MAKDATNTPTVEPDDLLALWKSVEKTDPKDTKSYKGRGGFQGTAISPMSLIKKATEKWGPMGGQWGIKILNENVYDGAPIMQNGAVASFEKLHVVRTELWYPSVYADDGIGRILNFGQTTMVGTNKYGPFTDEDAPKKSLTDALSKSLSWLGFGADVHMGMYDDSKYVADLKEEGKSKAHAAAKQEQAPKSDDAKKIEQLIEEIKGASNSNDLDLIRDTNKDLHARLSKGNDGEVQLARHLAKAMSDRRAALDAQPQAEADASSEAEANAQASQDQPAEGS